MRVLVVDAYQANSVHGGLGGKVMQLLVSKGHVVEYLSLDREEFAGFMTAAERSAYESDEPLIAEETKHSAALVRQADALLFVYPTTMFSVPPRLKSWLERVMVMGVAFILDDNQRVRPGLKHVRRLGVVTTTPHTARATLAARDLGRRTFMRTLRLNCHPLCKRSFVRLHHQAPAGRIDDQLARSLRRW